MKMPQEILNKSSSLLPEEENTLVFRLLGNRCQSIATGIAQLYTANAYSSQWVKKDTGILCFVKDNSRKNYFFRMFCLRRNMMIWEHEMYNNLEYNESTSFLHVFEGENEMVAFNFADIEEAKDFGNVVCNKIQMKKRREEKKQRAMMHDHKTQKTPVSKDLNSYKKTVDSAAKVAKRKRNITKADIGSPSDFKHISHVGWNPNSGFDINTEDEDLNSFFQKAGVSEKQLQDRDTREFIYDFINKNGGREAVEQVNNSARRAPPAIPTSNMSNMTSGPPVPPRGGAPSRPPHVRAAPPPPPTINTSSRAPPPPMMPVDKPAVPPPPSGGFVPPAPVPPPPPAFDIPANPPPPPMNDNSALLESIRQGTTLRPVEEKRVSPQEDARGDLLSEIRKGFRLKPVDERDIKPTPNIPEQGPAGDLAGALARALAERNKAFHSEDDDGNSSDDDSNDDEWD